MHLCGARGLGWRQMKILRAAAQRLRYIGTNSTTAPHAATALQRIPFWVTGAWKTAVLVRFLDFDSFRTLEMYSIEKQECELTDPRVIQEFALVCSK